MTDNPTAYAVHIRTHADVNDIVAEHFSDVKAIKIQTGNQYTGVHNITITHESAGVLLNEVNNKGYLMAACTLSGKFDALGIEHRIIVAGGDPDNWIAFEHNHNTMSV